LDTYFTGRPVLRRLNAVFISEEIVTANTTAPGRLARAGDAREDG
jgi:hypothetical protein